MANKKPLITIDHLQPERETIKILGHIYEMRSATEFGLKDQRRISQLGEKMSPLTRMETASDDELSLAEKAMDDILGICLPDLPSDLAVQIPSVYKMQLAYAFFTQLNSTLPNKIEQSELEEAETILERLQQEQSIGENISLISSSGTEAVETTSG